MIYGEDHRFRHLVMVVLILSGTLFASLWHANKLPDFLNFNRLQSSVLQAPTLPAVFTAEDLDYLENETGYVPSNENKTFEVNSTQPLTPTDLLNDLVQYLLAAEPRPATVDEGNTFLNEELFTVRVSPPAPAAPVLPHPANVDTVITAAVIEFFNKLSGATPTTPPTTPTTPTAPATKLSAEEFEYLENETGYVPLHDVLLEDVTLKIFQQDLIEILLTADPKPATKDAAILYLNEELFTDPIPPATVPATITQSIASAAEKSLVLSSIPPATGGSTFTPTPRPSLADFLAKFNSILSSYQAAAYRYQVFGRADTSRLLLDEFIKQL